MRLTFPGGGNVKPRNTGGGLHKSIKARKYQPELHLAFPELLSWSQQQKKYSLLNANKIRDTKREYRKNNVDKIRKYRRFYENNKRKTDIEYRLKKNLRLRVWQILNQKNSSNLRSLKLLGISINKYKIYLEKRFKPGMTWKNYGCKRNQWSIDHIMPCSYFDLTDISQQKKCFHYTNTQPLWHIDNIMKKDKILPKTI